MNEQVISQAHNGNGEQEHPELGPGNNTKSEDEPLGRPLSLLSLLNTISCPKRTERFLVKTNAEWNDLQALASLWQSLGRPTSVFWRETLVYPEKVQQSNPPCDSGNENEGACLSPDTFQYQVESYKNGHLTFSGWLLAVEGCPVSMENFLAGKSPPLADKGKELLCQWREAGFPDLGEWPQDGIDLFDRALDALHRVLNAQART
jgi:hypothetical protein